MLGTLETTFHGQKTFRLVGGSLSWSEKPYFHKGGPLRIVPYLPLSAKMKEKNFCENLSSFLSMSLSPGVQENGKKLGADLPPTPLGVKGQVLG